MARDTPDDLLFEFGEEGAHPAIDGDVVPTEFNEAAYLRAFPDIAVSIRLREWRSALDHYRRHGVRERRLSDPRYVRALQETTTIPQAERAAPPAHSDTPMSVDVLFTSPSGICLVIGWVDDRLQRLQTIGLASHGQTLAATTRLARCRRTDAETALATPADHLFGFWTVLTLPTRTALSGSAGVQLQLGGSLHHVAIAPKCVSNTQLRETVFEYLANASYFGNSQVEAFLQLTDGPGQELIDFSRHLSAGMASRGYVERFGPAQPKFVASIIVCLLGRTEFLFLQNALFASAPGCRSYEFIYVSNSPELAEKLQREARIAERIYGLSLTLVLLPGNAGFGAANNIAIQSARSDRIMIVNPDVFPRDQNWAATHTDMIKTLPKEQTSLFGATLFYDDGSLMHAGMYFDIDAGLSLRPDGIIRQSLIRVEHYGKGAPPELPIFVTSRAVPAVTGAFMSIDRTWFETLGGFSESYAFGHYEDADLCLKSLQRGRNAWVHHLPFWHFEGKGSDRRLCHEGGSLVNRWYFTKIWGEMIADDLCGQSPTGLHRPAAAT